ncbi:Na+/H+ antiporter NhaD/arsenite permease-like protein [Conyzicola lurida]|uniref:Na+/H+ antiporter NhaD/arsenite permease-like protein n=1 Tax=Conyzicola lurida TaxID=1172621 RepID=A0A841ARI3_9MICO|nr:Na+/H+ antiporter NhaD/arsenite permease-like protein [Conyzicola lurida]
MRTAIVGGVLLIVGAIAVALGILPLDVLGDLGERVGPILLFVIAITVVTELASEAGLFQWVAERTAAWGHGRAWLLWLFVVALATASTVFLSLDTTAVLLTPVVIILARHVGLNPLPFALTTVWLANTASLLLPVSNLTNLLAEHELGTPGPAAFAALTAPAAAVGVIVPSVVLFLVFRRDLAVRYRVETSEPIDDRVLLVASGVTIAVLIPSLVSGLPVWVPASVAALVLGAFFVVRRRSVVRFSLVPWQLVLFAGGLFLVMEAAHSAGLGAVLAAASGTGDDPLSLLRLAGVSATASNLVNNLPAYLALEPVAGSPERLIAVLIGANLGPLVTPWASLATLLWHQRLVQNGVELSWSRYVLLGLVAAPVTVALATLALAVGW